MEMNERKMKSLKTELNKMPEYKSYCKEPKIWAVKWETKTKYLWVAQLDRLSSYSESTYVIALN